MAEQVIEFEFDFRRQRYKDAARGFEALAKELGNPEKLLYPVVRKELQRFLDNVVEALARRHGNPYPTGTTGNSLSSRSGRLVESIKQNSLIKGDNLDNLVAEFGGIFYARIHEYGGTIKARRAKYLTIPLPDALNADGTPKKASARDWGKTFIIQSKKGNLLIVRREGKNLTPLYVLKPSVYIAPRLNLRSTVETGLPPWIDELGDKLVAALLEGPNG